MKERIKGIRKDTIIKVVYHEETKKWILIYQIPQIETHFKTSIIKRKDVKESVERAISHLYLDLIDKKFVRKMVASAMKDISRISLNLLRK